MKDRVIGMKAEQILQLLEAVSSSNLTEFKYEENDVKLTLKKNINGQISAVNPVHQMPFLPTPEAENEASVVKTQSTTKEDPSTKVVKSPLVGTFYTAPSEGSAPFVNIGDSVSAGQILAIVEAMKLMNDIESDFSGIVAEVLVQNGETVEYGQPLFAIRDTK
jgi:acetyl-CoA carboxylase biotin carboxyl carrier protein